jgi:hypothetical protein
MIRNARTCIWYHIEHVGEIMSLTGDLALHHYPST